MTRFGGFFCTYFFSSIDRMRSSCGPIACRTTSTVEYGLGIDDKYWIHIQYLYPPAPQKRKRPNQFQLTGRWCHNLSDERQRSDMKFNLENTGSLKQSDPGPTVLPFRAQAPATHPRPPEPDDEILESLLQETMDMLLRAQTVLRLSRSFKQQGRANYK